MSKKNKKQWGVVFGWRGVGWECREPKGDVGKMFKQCLKK